MISIIIPALNEENYIEKTLISLKKQKIDDNYEIIVADGGSEDKTVEIAKKYADKIVFEPKRTIAAGRQAGAKIADGEILVFTDADIFAPENWLFEITNPLKNKKTVGAHGLIIPYDGNKVDKTFCTYFFPPYSKLMIALGKPSVPGSNFSIKKEIFEKIGGFNTDLVTGEDVDIAKKAISYGEFIFNSNAVIYVSARRVKKWGYKKYITHYFKESLSIHGLKKNKKREYPPVR